MADSCFDSDSSDDFWNFAAGDARPGTSTAGNVDLSDIEVSSVHTSDLSDFSTGEFSDDNDDSYDSAAMEDVQDGDGWTSRLRDVTLNPFASSVGPQHDLEPSSSPLDFFFLLFNVTAFTDIAAEINRYAAFKQESVPDRRWTPTTPPEVKAFFGMQKHHSIIFKYKKFEENRMSGPTVASEYLNAHEITVIFENKIKLMQGDPKYVAMEM
ncbi:hypothetical protein CAPTEDRAFT_213572 [Capitella teleta]|uniref:PiggyBac transposable element-derived protein domain-containing protein n=1 Tax=Capitella teleta TaxID=283909 RepID=R7VBY6_CAPTE|nr:hypothetical protein CAPTEDRAFT_213572 [Capitella teleta]|eukprot:ELU16358.1 hypothetical protein CAPTEDRAFT_213572 [Capitella teleta]